MTYSNNTSLSNPPEIEESPSTTLQAKGRVIPVSAENELDVPETEEEAGAPETTDDSDGDFRAFIAELKAEGITVKDLKALKEASQTQAQAQSMYTMATHWDVSVSEATQRMELVKAHWETLSAEDKKSMDNIEGVYKLWSEIETTKRAGTVGKGRTLSSSSKATALYTQGDIDAMDETTRRKHDKRITYAYANGLVTGADL